MMSSKRGLTILLCAVISFLVLATFVLAGPPHNGGQHGGFGGGHHGGFQNNPHHHGNCPKHFESAPSPGWSFYYVAPVTPPCQHDWERWRPYDGWYVPNYGVYYGPARGRDYSYRYW